MYLLCGMKKSLGMRLTLSSLSACSGPIPTQQQQTTALIILGMIGAEFCEGEKLKRRSAYDGNRRVRSHGAEHEVMDQAVARVTAKTLQVMIFCIQCTFRTYMYMYINVHQCTDSIC